MSKSSIHILGIGNLGRLVAHALRKHHADRPITLLFHRQTLVEDWTKAGRSIEIVRNGVADQQMGFDYEIQGQGGSISIDKLIVATKTHATLNALKLYKDRLGSGSTLLFLQNGIGTIEEVTENLFTQPDTRPSYLAGIFNHGVFSRSPFSSVHIGLANAFIGPVSLNDQVATSYPMPRTTQELAQDLLECPELSASLVTRDELLHVQLQKLAVNAIINPLTAIFNFPNGEIFEHSEAKHMIDDLISELSAVFLAILTQRELGTTFEGRYSPEQLKISIGKVAEKTAENISSMRQDVLAGRKTEIDYINGYIVRQGHTLGVPCPTNKRIVRLIKEKRKDLYV